MGANLKQGRNWENVTFVRWQEWKKENKGVLQCEKRIAR